MPSDPYLSLLLGLAVGDALGVPVEFSSRQERDLDPVTEMRAFGTHHQPAGTWSDDTSLTLCLAESLAEGLDYRALAGKFLRWLEEGYWTAAGVTFDVGTTTRRAIRNFADGHEPTICGEVDEGSNGNGSLMRIAPLAFALPHAGSDRRRTVTFQVSALTHGHPRSKLACWLYVETLLGLLADLPPDQAVDAAWDEVDTWVATTDHHTEWTHFRRCRSSLAEVPRYAIESTGYVVHTLESALWCLLTSRSFPETVLKAVNLGGDTDTSGAVAGALAGVVYGEAGIPAEWLRVLVRKADIEALASQPPLAV